MHPHRAPVAPASSTTAELIPGRFIFSITRSCAFRPVFSFTIEGNRTFSYQPFFADFGPLALHQIHLFVSLSLNHLQEHNGLVLFYCSASPVHIANSILLAACFRLIHMGLAPDEALRPFAQFMPRVHPYRDACALPSSYDLTIGACVYGLSRAMKLGWYKFDEFDPVRWAELEQIDHGDMNWLIPRKLLACASPYHTRVIQGFRVCTPSDLVPVFRSLGITTVVRLNNKTYDENAFKDAGFEFVEMFFPDGTCPPDSILERFLQLIEGEAVVALHCKAGLGRTGTLAACHMIKKYEFTAGEAIGWIRICRPGSIIGPQQHYLVRYHQRIRQPVVLDRAGGRPYGMDLERDGAKTSAGRRPGIDGERDGPKTPPPARSRDGTGLRVQATSLTPPVPQPRKLQRAQDQIRTTPRKLG